MSARAGKGTVRDWVLLLPLAWALAVFLKYFDHLNLYLANGPLLLSGARWPEPAFSDRVMIWLQSAWILLVALALVGMTLAWGARLRGWLGLGVEDSWVRVSLNFGFGILGLDLFWLGTGLTHLWWNPLLAAALLSAGGLALWDGFIWFRRQGPGLSLRWPREFGLLAGLGLVYFLLVLGHGLAPETFYDSMVYHLAVPSDWLLRHGIGENPTNFFSNYPYAAELFFLNGLFLQGTEAAKCLHAAAFFFAAVLAGGWARERAGIGAGWLASGMILTFPLLTLNASTTQVEGVLAFFILLFLYALWKAGGQPSAGGRWFWAAGLLAGGALAVKYTAAVGLACGFLALGWAAWRKWKWSEWLLLGAGAGLLLGPWVLKNFAMTGNPFFPYASHWFSGRLLPPGGYDRLLSEQRAFNPSDNPWTLLWKLIMSNPDSYNFVGPLALAAAPFLLFRPFQEPVLGFWARASGFYLIGGLFITHILRFMAPAFTVFYLLAAVFFTQAGRVWARGLSLAAVLAACLCFFYLASISVYYYACGGIWWGKENRSQYLSGPGKITPYAPMARWISENLPADARLLIVGDSRGLYYDRPFLANSVFDEQVLARAARDARDASGIGLELKRLGVTHLAVNGPEGVRVAVDYHHYDLTPQAWGRLDEFFRTQTTLVYDQDFKSVYALTPPARPNGEPMPLLFFTAPGASFIRDYERQNWAVADRDLDGALALDPGRAFWWEQKADLALRRGRAKEAEKGFEKAAGLGPLTPHGYQDWIQAAGSLGLKAQGARVLAAARKFYPGQF